METDCIEPDWKQILEIALGKIISEKRINTLQEAMRYIKDKQLVQRDILDNRSNIQWITTRWMELIDVPPSPQSLPERSAQPEDSLDNELHAGDVPQFDREGDPYIMIVFCGLHNYQVYQPANYKFCDGSNCFMRASTAKKKNLSILEGKTTLNWLPQQGAIPEYADMIWHKMECKVLDDKEVDIQVDVLIGKDWNPDALGNDASVETSTRHEATSETRNPSHQLWLLTGT
ncbi:hypothetical protein F5882DRAFT_72511 [Hyaloscypha sp. PMI_1271]|nr:hypothetical protein F5882DRAFT_72511 [Hyaloscypha sp. PMI_1271]